MSPPPSISPRPPSSRVRHAVWTIFPAIFGLVLLVDGIITNIHVSQSTKWPTAEGIVTASTAMMSLPGRIILRFNAKVQYTYKVGGADYHGTFIDQSRRYDSEESALRAHRKGSRVTVHYDPVHPSDSLVAESGEKWATGGILIGLLLLCISILCARLWWESARRN